MNKVGVNRYSFRVSLLILTLILSNVTPEINPAEASPALSLPAQTLRTNAGSPTTVMLELVEEPAIVAYNQNRQTLAEQKRAVQSAVNRLEITQQKLLPELTRRGLKPVYRLQRLYNGIAIEGSTDTIDELRKMPGVKAIHPLPIKFRDNAGAMALTGAATAWASYAITGTGVKIGIIDTGIDYLHATFGGPGTLEIYNANDPTVATDTPGYFPNGPKVVDGFDFAGDSYDPIYRPIPDPDPDPIEKCNGQPGVEGTHGTHVAATAAGFGVAETGQTYTGAYNSSTPTSTMRIAPGVAPGAKLYALKVFGCNAGTRLVSKALEWALDPNGDGDFSDKMDVVNLSLGTPYGLPNDVDAQVANQLAAQGVVVVASAGNNGDNYYANSSPGNALRAISVAASEDAQHIVDGFLVNSAPFTPGVYPAIKSTDFPWHGPPPLGNLQPAYNLFYSAVNRTGCGDFTPAEKQEIASLGDDEGPVVLFDWVFPGQADCPIESTSITRVNKAKAAGAKAVIFAFQDPLGDPIELMGGALIPAIMVDYATGNLLRNSVPSGKLTSNVSLTLSNNYDNKQRFNNPARNDLVAYFSSRGGSWGNGIVKPDLSAPGITIFSAKGGSGNAGYTENGTSMAAPQVAGAAALLRQKYPDRTVEEIKASLMNSANLAIFTSPTREQVLGPARMGAGRLDIPAALANQVLVYNNNPDKSGAVSLSFGLPEITKTTILTETVKVVNKQNVAVSYTLGYTERTSIPGVNYSFPDGSTVNVPANGTAIIQVQLKLQPELMENSRDITVAAKASKNGLARAWLSEASGFLTLTPVSGPALHLPVHVAPRAASVMVAAPPTLGLETNNGSTSISLNGQPINSGNSYPTSTLSLVSAFEYAGSSPIQTNLPANLRSADLRHVGIASDAAAQIALSNPVTNSTIYFGLATNDNWYTPADQVTFLIYIDTNLDGKDDYILLNTRRPDTDVFHSLLITGTGGEIFQDWLNGLSPASYNTALFNNNVLIIPVRAADLKLGNGADSRFNYRIETFSVADFGQHVIDSFPTHSYDYVQPGLSFGSRDFPNIEGGAGVPTFRDLPGVSIPVSYNYQQYKLNNSQGLLLFHQHNAGINGRTQVINVVGPPCLQPFIVKQGEDNGNDICGSLSYALHEGLGASVSPAVTVTFEMPTNTLTLKGALPPVATTKTVNICSACSAEQPTLKIQPATGITVSYGLVVQSGTVNLAGVSLSGFSRRALKVQAGQTTVQCTNLSGGVQIQAGGRLVTLYPNKISY